jgi:hypothetical protein
LLFSYFHPLLSPALFLTLFDFCIFI